MTPLKGRANKQGAAQKRNTLLISSDGSAMNDIAQFSSECPRCKHDRVQSGYLREELIQLLQAGADIEAYCSNCDETWPVSVEERADIARALERSK